MKMRRSNIDLESLQRYFGLAKEQKKVKSRVGVVSDYTLTLKLELDFLDLRACKLSVMITEG